MLLQEENTSNLSTSKLFLIFGLFGLFITARKQFVDSYRGEPLVQETGTISEIPTSEGGGKITSRIQFNVKEHFAQFWIMNSGQKKYLEIFPDPQNSMKLGDTVVVYFLEHYKSKLTNPLNEIPIIGLKHNNKVLLDPRQIEQADNKWIFWGYVLSIPLLVTGAIIYIIKKRNINSLQ
jgi:hypothetical protein